MRKQKRFWIHLSVISFFIFATLTFFGPLLQNFSAKIIDDYDGLLITWSLNRVIQNFPNWPEKLMQGNIFYPHPHSHAYSDAFITDGLIALPFVKITGQPLVAFNINLIISQILLLYFSFLFLSEISGNSAVNFLLSLVFAFSQIRLHYLGHLQMFSLYWVPLAGYALLRFAKSSKIIYLYVFFLAFLAQTLNSFLPGCFIIFLFLALHLIKVDLRKAINKNFIHFLTGTVLSAIVLFPFVRIYLNVSKIFNYVRPIRDVIHFSLSPQEIFLPKFFSPVLILVFLVSLALLLTSKESPPAGGPPRRWLFVTAFFLLMAFGPFLHWYKKTLPIPLPYLIFYYLVPGFKGFRTPSRWIFMVGFSAVAFAAVVIDKWLFKKPETFRRLFYFGTIVLLLYYTKVPKNYFEVPKKAQYPKVYSWLKEQPGQVIVEIPIYYWGDFVYGKREVYRMLYSLEHKKKMVNGYSGFSPPEWEELVIYLRKKIPQMESLLKLRNIGVDYLIVHETEFKDLWPDDFKERFVAIEESNQLREIYNDGKDLVYEFQKIN